MDDSNQRTCLRIGITGGLGSGKSTFCEILKQLGAALFNADDKAKQILIEDETVRTEVKKEFGDDIYSSSGELQKARLAQRAFSSEENTKKINAIIHPRVYQAFESWAAQSEQKDAKAIVIEAALIIETAYHKNLDITVIVTASKEERVKRAVQRGMDEDDVHARIGKQRELSQFGGEGVLFISNDGTVSDLEESARYFWRKRVDRMF